jgi:hypothetical protein
MIEGNFLHLLIGLRKPVGKGRVGGAGDGHGSGKKNYAHLITLSYFCQNFLSMFIT